MSGQETEGARPSRRLFGARSVRRFVSGWATCAAGLLLLAAFPNPSAAEFISETQTFSGTGPVSFDRFDPSLGKLESVTVQMTATNPYIGLQVANLSTSAVTVSGTASPRADVVIEGLNDFVVAGAPKNLPSVLLQPGQGTLLEATDFALQGATTDSSLLDLPFFSQGGLFQVQVKDLALALTSPGGVSLAAAGQGTISGGWSGTLTVSYAYVTPEPSSLCLLGLGFLGGSATLLWRRYQVRRAPC